MTATTAVPNAPGNPVLSVAAPDARSIHLLDIENLLGTADFTFEMVSALKECYSSQIYLGAEDHVVIAASHFSADALMFGWAGARILLRSGPDGADQKLLDVLTNEGIVDRYAHIVLGSGDGIFAHTCRELEQAQPHLTVVAKNAHTLSGRIRAAASDVRYLEPSPDRFLRTA